MSRMVSKVFWNVFIGFLALFCVSNLFIGVVSLEKESEGGPLAGYCMCVAYPAIARFVYDLLELKKVRGGTIFAVVLFLGIAALRTFLPEVSKYAISIFALTLCGLGVIVVATLRKLKSPQGVNQLLLVLLGTLVVLLIDLLVHDVHYHNLMELHRSATRPFEGTMGEASEHSALHLQTFGILLLYFIGELFQIGCHFPEVTQKVYGKTKEVFLPRVFKFKEEILSYFVAGVLTLVPELAGLGPIYSSLFGFVIFLLTYYFLLKRKGDSFRLPRRVLVNFAFGFTILVIVMPVVARGVERQAHIMDALEAESETVRDAHLTTIGLPTEITRDELLTAGLLQSASTGLLAIGSGLAVVAFLAFWIYRGYKQQNVESRGATS